MNQQHHDKLLRTFETKTMTSHSKLARFAVLAALAVLSAVPGCIEPGPRIERVQTNLIDKSTFEGEWWFTHTVIDLDDDASWSIGQAGTGAPWPGATANFDIASQSGVVGRIRWVIDENVLFAYRTTEIVRGSSPDARDSEFRGQPLAAYRIVGHFDVRQDFNPITGEPGNVVSEAQDRRWYDRRFVRVDWSQNLIRWGLFGASLEIDELFGGYQRESIPLGITDEGTVDLPAEWAPQYVRVRDEIPCDQTTATDGACYRFLDEWPSDQLDTVHYMSFVTQEMWTPLQCFGPACETSVTITTRDAFLRIPPEHEYAVETLANSEYDRFGIIRTESRTYLRGGDDRRTLGRHCDSGADCDPGCADGLRECETYCDLEPTSETFHVCVGGLTNELGETDFLTYYRLRHNFYSDSLTDQECVADWQCNDRYTAGGVENPEQGGSVCDQNARRCTIPQENRDLRQVRYTLSADYPTYLVRSSFEIVSMWNEAFMRGNREQREGLPDARTGATTPGLPTGGAPVTCQSTDPTMYCFCNGDFLSPEVEPASRSCAYQTNFFIAPEARGEENPYQCWVAGPDNQPYVDHAAPGEFTDYDADMNGDEIADVYQLHFEGPECMLVLDVNTCNRIPGAACQQLGDVRYQFFNFVSGAGAGWCGVMQPNQDPITGEAIISPVNQGGLCLDNIAQQALNIWPVLRGEASADELFQGEEVRRYFESLGRVRQPLAIAPGARPGTTGGGARPSVPTDLLGHIEETMLPNLERVRDLHGPEARARLLSDRLGQVAGTPLEHRLVDGIAAENYAGLASRPLDQSARGQLLATHGVGIAPDELVSARGGSGTTTSDAMLDRVSPFRDGFTSEMMADRRRQELLEQSGTCMLTDDQAYTALSQYGVYWANAFEGRPVAEARIRWAQAWHRAIMQHELGHGLGLEHNFAGTLDRDHYFPPYYRIAEENPLPLLESFDTDRDNAITDVEANAWLAEMQRVRRIRNEAGIGNYTASTTMDYPGDLSDIMAIGFYDRAAVYYNYFNMVEAFQGDPRTEDPETSLDGLLRSDRNPRELWTWYRGGDSCRTDSQCPYTAGSTALAPGQPIHQRCVANPRYSSIPIPCGEIEGDPEAASHCICSNFDEDFSAYVDATAYREPTRDLPHYPVRYLFCSNSRMNDISWCNAFDAGETFLEVISNMRSSWEQSYPTSYFRRFRRPFYAGTRTTRWIPDAAKIYQHLLFRLYYEPGFSGDAGPLGLEDQYMASIEAMNFFSYLAQLPDVGSYQYDATTDVYEHIGEEMGMAGADFSLAPGQGFYTWSAYQEGLQGFFRLERAGTFFDKLVALRALTTRDWGLNFTIDERYFINFYDFFPVEMTELFGGYIVDDPHWFSPRVDMTGGAPTLEYLNWYRGNCRDASTGLGRPCRGSNPEEFPATPLGGTTNDVLRVYAAVYALAEFPVFYDSSWEQRLAVFKLGNADGFDVPDLQPDGAATCAFGTTAEDRIEDSHDLCAASGDADYILYRSQRLHTTYVAVKVRPRIDYNLPEEQLGFELLLQMTQNQEAVRSLEALPSRTPAQDAELRTRRTTLERNESFLETLIEVQRIFGITSWL